MTTQDCADAARVEALERLERALIRHSVVSHVEHTVPPRLRVIMPGIPSEIVYVDQHAHDPRYRWDGLTASHPADDAPGAAQRLAQDLRTQLRRMAVHQ